MTDYFSYEFLFWPITGEGDALIVSMMANEGMPYEMLREMARKDVPSHYVLIDVTRRPVKPAPPRPKPNTTEIGEGGGRKIPKPKY